MVRKSNETHISTKPISSRKTSWLPFKDGYKKWQTYIIQKKSKGTQAFICIVMANALPSMKIRNDFINIAVKGKFSAQNGLILQAISNLNISKDIKTNKRIGITVTKKVGSAVVRNRCRRRLKAVANEIILYYGKDRADYVLIAKKETFKRKINLLKLDLKKALKELGFYKKFKN